jgi:hypothetical protein
MDALSAMKPIPKAKADFRITLPICLMTLSPISTGLSENTQNDNEILRDLGAERQGAWTICLRAGLLSGSDHGPIFAL